MEKICINCVQVRLNIVGITKNCSDRSFVKFSINLCAIVPRYNFKASLSTFTDSNRSNQLILAQVFL